MEGKESIIISIALLALFVVAYFIRLFVKRRKYARCPKCGRKTKLKWVKHEVESSPMDHLKGSRIHSQTKIDVYLAMCCEHCGHEIAI